jgi:flagellin
MNISNVPNINALATNSLTATQTSLATGRQINQSADNPAAMAVATSLTTQSLSFSTGVRNANDGISMLQTADGATRSMTAMSQRMYELSMQSVNGTLNASDRGALNAEFKQNLQEMQRIAQTTQFNGINLLGGEQSSLKLALGLEEAEIGLPNLSTQELGIDGYDLSNPDNASLAAQAMLNVTQVLAEVQSQFGAQQNGLNAAANNMMQSEFNTQSSLSQIQDTNLAQNFTARTRDDILQNAALAMFAQSNQDQSSILKLLS